MFVHNFVNNDIYQQYMVSCFVFLKKSYLIITDQGEFVINFKDSKVQDRTEKCRETKLIDASVAVSVICQTYFVQLYPWESVEVLK